MLATIGAVSCSHVGVYVAIMACASHGALVAGVPQVTTVSPTVLHHLVVVGVAWEVSVVERWGITIAVIVNVAVGASQVAPHQLVATTVSDATPIVSSTVTVLATAS